MNITHRVLNRDNKTCGFIINNEEYQTYGNVLNNIKLFDNITVEDEKIIKEKEGKLDIASKRDVNEKYHRTLVEKNELVREIQQDLEAWKNNNNDLVLYIIGARQIGKTTEILKFAYKNYEQVIYVNLAKPNINIEFQKAVLDTNIYFGLVQYCMTMRLEEFDNSRNTILIIDEIQENINVYNSIRELQSGLKCDVAITGSYLGKTINSKYFKPAGNTLRVEMLPLSFTEFCNTFGCGNLLHRIDLHGKDSSADYEKLYQLYLIYMQIGGYPSVVSKYKKTKSIEACMDLLRELIDTFTDESASYFKDDKSRIIFENVYKEAFRTIAYEKKGTSSKDIETITGFVKESTKEHVSRSEVNDALSWLKFSHIIGSCDLYNQGKVSQLLNERRFYFMDCGIANCISGMTPIDNDTVRGILTENFAYTELYRLYKKNLVKGDKPCCSVFNNHELDFMIVDQDDKRYGIEIKSSNEDEPGSLLIYLEKDLIDEGYLAGKTKGGIRKKFRSIPIYTVGCRFPYN